MFGANAYRVKIVVIKYDHIVSPYAVKVLHKADGERVVVSASLFDDNLAAEVAVNRGTWFDRVVGLDVKNARRHDTTPEFVDRVLQSSDSQHSALFRPYSQGRYLRRYGSRVPIYFGVIHRICYSSSDFYPHSLLYW